MKSGNSSDKSKNLLFLVSISILLLFSSTILFGQNTKPTPIVPTEKVAEDDEVISVETNLVSFPVSVLGKDGVFVQNLKKEDFKIFENGVEQQIEYFAPVDEAFTVVLLIDRSDSVAPIISDLKKAATAFVDQLRPNDRAIGIAFDRKAYILNNKVRDRETLKNSINNMTTGAGTHLHSTIEGVINRVFRGLKGRKALIVFTDGQEAWSWDQPKGAIPQFTAATNIQAAEETGTQIYSIQFDSNFRTKEGDKFMKDIPAKTGGMFFRADKLKDFNKVFGQIADELRFQYSIGYYQKDEPKKGERRQIKVTVNQPNTNVRNRSDYVFAK
jgi:Ca-activated chloride channel homolog